MNDHELEPWVVAINDKQVALWQMSEPSATALALFSNESKAQAYAQALHGQSGHAVQPSKRELLGLMIQCYQQQIAYAVLDPNETQARSIFQLREVLKAARSSR